MSTTPERVFTLKRLPESQLDDCHYQIAPVSDDEERAVSPTKKKQRTVTRRRSGPGGKNKARNVPDTAQNSVADNSCADTGDSGMWGAAPYIDGSDVALVDKRYQKYLKAVTSEAVGFYQINTLLCVVQGWNVEKECATVSMLE